LISLYRAESRGHIPKKYRLQESETLIFDYVKNVCESMLGREQLMIKVPNPIDEKTVDEILGCLRKIRKSVDRWNKRGGQQGYLQFVSNFIK